MKFLNKTIEYGLYLLVFLLPLQTRWIIKAGELNGGPWEYGAYSLYATDVLLIAVLLLFVFVIASDRRERSNLTYSDINQRLPRRPEYGTPRNDRISNNGLVYWFIGGLLLMSAVSVFFAASGPLALYKLGWLILGAGLFWLIISANYNRLKLIYAILAGVFLQAVLGIWQFLSQSSFANKWLGLALHNASDLGTSVIEAVGSDGVLERWLRAYGGLDHPNMLGGLLAVGMLLLIGQMVKFNKSTNTNPPYPPLKGGLKGVKFSSRIIYWAFLITFTMALFFSFSRSAWLGLALGLVIMMVLAVVGKNLKQQRSLAEIILVMGIVLFVIFSQYQNLATARLAGEGRLENKSTSERLVSYQESWQMIKNNWAIGVGLGNYTLALSRQIPGQESFYYQPTHNVFLLVWAEVGIVGLLFFVGLLFVVMSGNLFCHSGRRAGIQFGRDEQVSGLRVKPAMTRCLKSSGNDNMAVILIALVVIMSLDHWLFSLHFGVLFFWLVLGLAASGERDEKSGLPPARE